MGLHHFRWNGKERAVSINKSSGNITLRFIDEEIIDQGLGKIIFTKGQSIGDFVKNYHGQKQQLVQDLLLSVKEQSDFIKLL